ncbi:hypothetical protein AAG906_006845 [Vitis piasezkii]
MFGVSTTEVIEKTQTIPVPELLDDDSSLFEGTISPVKGVSDLVDPLLSFDVLSGFVFHSNDVSITSFMDLSIFEYSLVSYPIDKRASPATGDVETIDFGIEDQPREMKIGLPLSTNERDRLIYLLRSYLDVFAWSYEDMSSLDPSIVQHHLPIMPRARPYPEWLANIIPVPKNDGKVRVCVDFRDFNKASPKDDFPFPHIDLLVDSMTGHSMLSFTDEFLGYNHILMALEDMEKRTFITEDVEVYVDDMIMKSRGRVDHLKFRLRLNPKKCTFGVTSRKLLGHMVSERGIEVNPDKIRAILDMLVSRTKKEIMGFLGSASHARTSTSSVFVSFKHGLGIYVMIERLSLALVWATRRLRHYMTEYSVHLISRLDPLRYLFDRAALTASLPTSDDRPVDDDFPNEEFVAMINLSGWCMYFDGAANQSKYGIVEYEACILGLKTALELGIRQMNVFGDSNLVLKQIQGDWKTRDNRFADALVTLASSVDISIDVVVRPLLIELRSITAYYCLIGETEVQDGLPWYHDIYQFLRFGTYPEVATTKDQRALRQLATRFLICGETLYRQSADDMLLLCLDRDFTNHMMREISPKSSNGHEFILVAIGYFTKWVEAISYARLTYVRVASFIRSHIIYRYRVPHELISDRRVHFRAEAYRTSFHTSIGAIPYSLMYGLEAVLPIELEMGSLRVVLEQQIYETE